MQNQRKPGLDLIRIFSALLVICLIFAGGLLILIPLAMLGAAFGLLKGCVK